MIIGALTGFISSLFLNLLLPALLGTLFATLVSGLTILDPLYAGERVGTAWGTLKSFLILQTFHTFISAPASGVLTGILHKRITSGWLYVLGAFLTVSLHYVFTFIFIIASSLVFHGEAFSSIAGTSFFIVTFAAPTIGLFIVFAVRRWNKRTVPVSA